MRTLSLLPLVCCLLVVPFRSVDAGPPSALEVTSDTVAYCHALHDRLRALRPEADIVRLGDEGSAMCDQGHVRVGIVRLRRALLLARDPDPTAN